MSDSKDEPTQSARESAPDSALAERLLARGTRSLGVIDVRHTESQYARIMDWLAGRTPLLEHLRSRYGLTEDDRAGSLSLAFADAHGQARAQGSDEAFNLSAAPDRPTAPVAEQFFTAVAHVPEDLAAPPTETKRISRRGIPTFSHVSSETRSGAGAHREREEGVESTPEQVSLSPGRARGLQAPPSVKEISGASTTGAAQTLGSLSSSSEQASVSSTGRAVTARAFSANGEREAANPNVPRVTESSNVKPLPLEAVAMRVRGQVGERREVKGADVTSEEGEPTFKRRGAAEDAKAQTVKTETGTTLVAREMEAATVSVEATSRSAETRLPLAQAREMPADTFKHDRGVSLSQSPLTLAASPLTLAASQNDGERTQATQTRRASANGADAVRQVSADGTETFTTGHGRASGKSAGVNVERLTEQVSRHLARRVLVERERRGLGKR
jgi:hypothetical protein